MDFREPLLGRPNSDSTSPGIIRKKSDHPILSLISPRRTSSPRTTEQFCPFDQSRGGGGGSDFQVGSVPSRIWDSSPETAAPSSATGSGFLGLESLLTANLSGVGGILRRIPEEPHPVPEEQEQEQQQSWSAETAALAAQEQGDELDLEAPPSPVEERNGYNDEANDSNRGYFGESLTDDAQEPNNDDDDKFSWASGLAGLLLSVPLLPSLPEVLNPFSRSPDDDDDDDDFFPRCTSCKQYHSSDYKHSLAAADDQQQQQQQQQHGPAAATPKSAGGVGAFRDLLDPITIPSHLSLPDLLNAGREDGHSLQRTAVPANLLSPANAFSTKDDNTEALGPYAPVAAAESGCSGPLQHYVGKHGKKNIRRCRTAPMLTGLVNFHTTKCAENKKPAPRAPTKSASSVVWEATMGLCLYLSLGVVVYTWKKEEFSGIETVGVIDALYFCIVTMCTIGYGDITPTTPSAKLLACALVFVGFGFIDALMSGMVTFVLDRQEHLLLTVMEDGHHEKTKNVIMDAKKRRMRIRMKVALAVGTSLSALTVGTIVLRYMEDLSWIDALYAACISITTVGYGDISFQTAYGRLFAAVWLLFSTLGVARAFLFLAEARVHSRHRRLAKRVLKRKMTTNDLMAMDLNNDGHVTKSEFVVYKLKEMGKINERDIAEVGKQFDDIDDANAGKITLAQLLEGEG